MKHSSRILVTSMLILSLSAVALGGTITGSRSSRTGTITGSRVGTITGSKVGTITGSRRGTITGSAVGGVQGINESIPSREEWLSRVMTFVLDLYF